MHTIKAGVEVRVADEKKYVDVQLSPEIEEFVKQREASIARGSVKGPTNRKRRGGGKKAKKEGAGDGVAK